MPVEPTSRPDGSLLDELEAFGRTLDDLADGPITSPGITEIEVISISETTDHHRQHGGTGGSASPTLRWVAAAAAALVAVALGAAVLAARTTDEADPTPANEGSTASTVTEDGDDDAARTDTEPEPDERSMFVPIGPSTVLAADGSLIGEVLIEPASGVATMTYASLDGGDEFATAYVDMTIGDLLADRELLTDLGWRPELTDADDQPLTAQRWLAQSGLTITTHMDRDLTTLAAAAMDTSPAADSEFDTAIVSIEQATAGVVVYRPSFEHVFWRSTLSDSNPDGEVTPSVPLDDEAVACCLLAPGSAFKSIVLATAFEQGYGPDDLISASGPCTFEVDGGRYRVGGSFRPPGSLAAATRSSNNCAYVRLGLVVGGDATVATASVLGLNDLPPDAGSWASLPLGTAPVDPIELTGVYASFANDGRRVEPRFMAQIADADGTIRWRSSAGSNGPRVISSQTARQITSVLTSTVESGTGRKAQLDGRPVAGKTGTTGDFRAAWFVGYTSSYTTTVWMADHEQGRRIVLPGYGTVFGGEVPAMIWHDFMEPAHLGIEPEPFPEPAPVDREPQLLEAPGEITLPVPDE